MLGNGEIQQNLSEINAPFGLYDDTSTTSTTTSLASANYTATAVMAEEKVRWRFPAGTQSIELAWHPFDQRPDTALLTADAQDGLITGATVQRATRRSASSGTLAALNGLMSVNVVVAARAVARRSPALVDAWVRKWTMPHRPMLYKASVSP
jgi:hypothetical protein